MSTPRLEIDLACIAHNVRKLVELYGAKGISITGVTKGVCGDPRIARVFHKNGIGVLGDARLANMRRMRQAGIEVPFLLVRLPAMSEAQDVITHAAMSLNTEMAVMRKLSEAAQMNNTVHRVILMVELGDLREGIMPEDLVPVARQVLDLKGLHLAGIGTSLFCYGGVQPDDEKMRQLSDHANQIERELGIALEVVSGGSSVNYLWFKSAKDVGRINNLRLGESLLLGGLSLEMRGIPDLSYKAFRLVAEVIESKVKPSLPWGTIGLDGFGNKPEPEDRGLIRRAIVNVGRQDVFLTTLFPEIDIDVLGASSDHLILDAKTSNIGVSDEVGLYLDYNPMMLAMTSPYVEKVYLHEEEAYGAFSGPAPPKLEEDPITDRAQP